MNFSYALIHLVVLVDTISLALNIYPATDTSTRKMATRTSTKTFTKTTGSGENKVTTTIVEETIIRPDGSKEVKTTETVQHGSGKETVNEKSSVTNDMGKLQITAPDNHPKPAAATKKVQTSEELKAVCLKAHNEYRQRHEAPPLTMDEDLCQFAQNWANHLAATNSMQHSDRTLRNGDKLGENVFFQYPEDNSGQRACDSWYDEHKKYDYSNNDSMIKGTGHFTQMVWKSSTKLGVGKAVSSDGKVYVVANYQPPGNYARQFKANVSQPK